MQEKEIWKDICEHNGDYKVSDFGNIKSLKGREAIQKKLEEIK